MKNLEEKNAKLIKKKKYFINNYISQFNYLIISLINVYIIWKTNT